MVWCGMVVVAWWVRPVEARNLENARQPYERPIWLLGLTSNEQDVFNLKDSSINTTMICLVWSRLIGTSSEIRDCD